MNVIVKLLSGSRLYGTDFPGSDTDYRGIYLPSKEDCYMGRIQHTIKDETEEDTVYFSLQRFLDLAAQGKPMQIEMLFTTTGEMGKNGHVIWDKLFKHRKMFLTKKLSVHLDIAEHHLDRWLDLDDKTDYTLLYHALRFILQIEDIMYRDNLNFPLTQGSWLKSLRKGNPDAFSTPQTPTGFSAEGGADSLRKRIDSIRLAIRQSPLPDSVDPKWCEQFIMEAYDS